MRLFRALLLLYPAAFRDEYGRELTLVFADRYGDASGPWERLRLWSEVVSSLLTEAAREHLHVTAHDCRYAVRRLRRSPGFASAAIASLALAIASSTAMVAVADAVLLRPLPYPSPERLVMLWSAAPDGGPREVRSAYADVEQWREQSSHIDDLAVFDPVSALLRSAGETEPISVAMVAPDVFSILGIQPVRGRTFSALEASGRRRVAMISDRLWQARFGRNPRAVGTSLELDGQPVEIVGVLPAGLAFPGLDADVWQPHTLFADWDTRRLTTGGGSWFVLARLRPDSTIEQAQADMRVIAARLDRLRPASAPLRSIEVMPLRRYVVGARAGLVVWLLAGASLGLLLVAVANVAGLSLARGIGRLPEMSIRTALGASRSRIARQLLVEGLTLAVVSGLLGLLVASLALSGWRAYTSAQLPLLERAGLDARVIAWAVLASVSTGLILGLVPAWTLRRRDLRPGGVEGGRGTAGGAAVRMRRALVTTECALAIVLLAGAGLLIRSWWNVTHVPIGFRPAGVLSVNVALPASLGSLERTATFDLMVERIGSLPGVAQAAITSELFVGTVADQNVTIETVDGRVTRPLAFRSDEIGGPFLAAMGTPLVAGRALSAADGPLSPRVAIVNQAMAARLWPGLDPIGQHFTRGRGTPDAVWITVVGVAADMRRQDLETEPVAQMFEPLAQNPPRRVVVLVLSSAGSPLTLAPSVRAAIAAADPRAAIYQVSTVEQRIGRFLSQRRLQTLLLATFAAAALLLMAIGLYGLMHYTVAMRTQEIGIRLALGALPADIVRTVVAEGLALSMTGLAIGLAGALWLGQAGSSLLFGVTPGDPATLAAVAILLLAVAAAACYLPARRAVRVSPLVALQHRQS